MQVMVDITWQCLYKNNLFGSWQKISSVDNQHRYVCVRMCACACVCALCMGGGRVFVCLSCFGFWHKITSVDSKHSHIVRACMGRGGRGKVWVWVWVSVWSLMRDQLRLKGLQWVGHLMQMPTNQPRQ